MTRSDDEIAAAQRRAADLYTRRPSSAFDTKAVDAHVAGGLRCRVTDGTHEVHADMPEAIGGDGSAPSPGYYARAGIASCVAIGVRMTAAREGIDCAAVDVRVETDFDDSALLGLGANQAGPLATRVVIRVTSDAPAQEVEAMVERALAADPWFLALRNAQVVEPRVEPAGRG